jgi:hypothetical protein
LRLLIATLSSIVAQSWPPPQNESHDFNYAIGAVGFDALAARHFYREGLSSVAFPTDLLPKRYSTDKNGHRVLIGLTIEETFEFETLDDFPPLDENGDHVGWSDGVPITTREKRWLELYQKHHEEWKTMVAEKYARRPTKRRL